MIEREKLLLQTATRLARGDLASGAATVYTLDTDQCVEKALALIDRVSFVCARESQDDAHPLEALAQEAPVEPPSLREALRGVGRSLLAKF